MAGLDEISEAIGGLRSDVRYIRERVDYTHDSLHRNGGISSRLAAVEHKQTQREARAGALGAVAGATAGGGVVAFWKVIAAKVGLG